MLIPVAIASVALLLCAIVACVRLRRSARTNDRLELGAVSRQWLLVHEGDEP